MKKIYITLGVILGVMLLMVGVVSAKDKAEHLYLYEKDSFDWSIEEDGAWGKLMYKGDKFVFNGHGLEVGVDYTLISYKEPWAGCGSKILGIATSNDEGNVHIMGPMPTLVVNNYAGYTTGDYVDVTGSKIWLVPTDDFPTDGECFAGWNPTSYLFENNLI
jgi:hypothetical protein